MIILAIAAVSVTSLGLSITGLVRWAGSRTPHWEIRRDSEVS